MGHCRTSQHPARAPEHIHRTGTSVVVPARQCLHWCQQVFAHLRLSEHSVQRVAIVAMRKQSHATLHGEWRLIHERLDAHPLLRRHTPTHTPYCAHTLPTAPTHSNAHPLLRPHSNEHSLLHRHTPTHTPYCAHTPTNTPYCTDTL
jgi:hypothetical protein